MNVETYDERAAYLLRMIAESPLPPEWDRRRRLLHHSIARLGLGVRCGEAFTHMAGVLADPGREDVMFLRHPLADSAYRFAGVLPPGLMEALRGFLCEDGALFELDSGTENHRLMNAVSGYLAARRWPDWAEASAVAQSCAAYLEVYFNRTVRYGQGEFDSPTYSVLYLNTMATLYDFAPEPLLKRQAGMMLDWYLLNMAGEWLNGHMGGAHSREYGAVNGPEHPSGGQVAGWLYFGGRLPNLYVGEPHYAAINALSAYRLPEAIAATARKRESPYVHRESHDLTDSEGNTHDSNGTVTVPGGGPGGLKGYGYISRAGVRKYTYVHPRYVLGSMTDGKEGHIVWSGQLRRWSLKWDSPDPCGVMFATHPFPDYNPDTDRYRAAWQGSSPYEQVLQHGGALVGVYRIPSGAQYKFAPRRPFPSDKDPYLEAFIPRTSVRFLAESGGWLFGHAGAVLFGLRFGKRYRWVPDEMPTRGHPVQGRVRSEGLRNALVVETRGACVPDSDPDGQREELEAFARLVADRTEATFLFLEGGEDGADRAPAVRYRSLSGDVLQLEYDGPRLVNGLEPDEAGWPLIGNPWVHSAAGSGLLTVDTGRWRRVYDYRSWTFRDSGEPNDSSE